MGLNYTTKKLTVNTHSTNLKIAKIARKKPTSFYLRALRRVLSCKRVLFKK